MESQKLTQYKNGVFEFLHLNFLFTFYNNFDENVKRLDFSQKFFESCAFYGPHAELEPEP
jgi:hypothetical protein